MAILGAVAGVLILVGFGMALALGDTGDFS